MSKCGVLYMQIISIPSRWCGFFKTTRNIYVSLNVFLNWQSFRLQSPHLLIEHKLRTIFRAGYSSEYQLPEEQWALVHDFFRLRVAQVATIHLVYKMFPRDILIVLEEPMLAYLKYDKLPIDRLEEVQKETLLRLTPEQVTFITNGAM